MTAERGGFEGIEGYFGAREAELYRHQVRRASTPARFVEIGSWMGRSSLCMAEAIRDSGKDIEFWCVDTWGGSDEHTDVAAVQEGSLVDAAVQIDGRGSGSTGGGNRSASWAKTKGMSKDR